MSEADISLPLYYNPEITEYEDFVFHVHAVYNTSCVKGIILNNERIVSITKNFTFKSKLS